MSAQSILVPRTHKSRGLIMVADDSAADRLILRRLLEAEGYDVVEARDGVEALAQLA